MGNTLTRAHSHTEWHWHQLVNYSPIRELSDLIDDDLKRRGKTELNKTFLTFPQCGLNAPQGKITSRIHVKASCRSAIVRGKHDQWIIIQPCGFERIKNLQKYWLFIVSPSQSVRFTPLRGKLQAQLSSNPAAGPPLSVENTITELLYKPLALSVSSTCKDLPVSK